MSSPRVRTGFVAQQRDRLRDHVIGGDDEFGQRAVTVAVEDLKDAGVVDVVRIDEREEKAGVEEDHSCGSL